jgi:hypothetical protein
VPVASPVGEWCWQGEDHHGFAVDNRAFLATKLLGAAMFGRLPFTLSQ